MIRQPDPTPTPPATLPPGPAGHLSHEDDAALDAVLESLADDRHGTPTDPAVGHPAARLLALAASPVPGEHDTALTERTLAFIGERTHGLDRDAELTGPDQDALEALMLAGFDPARVTTALRPRAERLAFVGTLIGAGADAPAELRPDLVDRTLDAIARAEASGADRFRLRRRGSALSNVRWADIISIAAVLLLMSAVAMPVLSATRSRSQTALCNANLGATASALGLYAGDYRAALPVATAGFAGSWMNVGAGPEESNSANLYTLVRTGYAKLASLACPGNRAAPTAQRGPDETDWHTLEEVSYSYQIVANHHPRWRSQVTAGPLIVLTDRSPVVLRAAAGDVIDPWENSPNHAREGQHALRNDGSTAWITSPVQPSGDNIWLPRGIELLIDEARSRRGLVRIHGTELPDTPDDVFLGP